MKRIMVRAGIVLLLVGAAGSALAARIVWARLSEPYRGYDVAEQFVVVPSGSSTAAITRRLVEAGIVRDAWTFRAALWWTDRSRALQAGEYRFDVPMSPVEVVQKIARGDIFTLRITFREGLTIREMADVYAAGGFGAAPAFIEAASHPASIADLDPEAEDLEGYLFPETYAVPRRAPAATVVAMMVDRFRVVYGEELRQSAATQGLTSRQVVTLASLVEKETGDPTERPLVAAVYRNRLRIGMGLQADPTVVYALQRAGRYDGNIRRQDLSMDSPYNTYRYSGLPPGPIAAPGEASLRAALMPAQVDYLYFVSRNNGSHAFARTLAEHNRNVREFQILYFRRQGAGAGSAEAR